MKYRVNTIDGNNSVNCSDIILPQHLTWITTTPGRFCDKLTQSKSAFLKVFFNFHLLTDIGARLGSAPHTSAAASSLVRVPSHVRRGRALAGSTLIHVMREHEQCTMREGAHGKQFMTFTLQTCCTIHNSNHEHVKALVLRGMWSHLLKKKTPTTTTKTYFLDLVSWKYHVSFWSALEYHVKTSVWKLIKLITCIFEI